jgi:phosphoglycolate phosphatase-like HAD superfamily hydrolase
MPLSAIIFDLDGTLADTLPVCIGAYQYTFEKYLQRWVPQDEIAAEFGRTEEGILKTFVPAADQAALLGEYMHHYEELHDQVNQPFPGVFPLLDLLRSRDIPVAIVTGKGYNSAIVSIRELGLAPYFQRVEVGADSYNNKTENIQRILADWGLNPSEAAYVGDTTDDMHCAAAAGVLPLGAGWGQTATVIENDGAARVFRSIDEFQRYIEDNTASE